MTIIPFSVRRRRYSVALIVLLLLAGAINLLLSITLQRTALVSGWVLFALVAVLASYNLRKRISFLPLGSSSTWLQVHVFLGLLSIAVFGMHVGWRVPNGYLEVGIAVAYLVVAASGIIGLWISRVFPRRLSERGEEVFYSRIPRVLRRIQVAAEREVLACLTDGESTAIPEFYSEELRAFFERHRYFWQHMIRSQRGELELIRKMDLHGRYLNEQEKQTMESLAEYVRVKSDLDFHFSHQLVLKVWLFIHVPLTYALVVMAIFHVVIVYAFSGAVH